MSATARTLVAPTSATNAAPTTTLEPFASLGLVGDSRAMQRLRAEVRRYAPRTATVLVLGETGSGKELVARALHLASPRAHAPFVAVNVATLRRELLTSELFGHERGAFSGAVLRHRGVFEQAHNGTLLLDEIGELAPEAQADLLRVLETGEVRPVGSDRPRLVSVRLVAATHRDLAAKVAKGEFREDLYYRLHVLPVVTPPLRERPEDLPGLVAHLLARLRPDVGERRLTDRAFAALSAYAWPGNARQLLNVLRRATARTDAPTLDTRAVLDALAVEPEMPRVSPYHARVEVPLTAYDIDVALRETKGSVAGAARRLGVPRTTLRDRIRGYTRLLPSTTLDESSAFSR